MISAILTDIMGLGIIIVLLRMNHTIGGLGQSLLHFGKSVDDHEARLRIREASPPPATVIVEKESHVQPGDSEPRRNVPRGS